MRTVWLAIAATLAASPLAAQELIDGSKVDAIVELARGYGTASIESQSDGSPRITGKLKGVPYYVFLMNCANGVCEDLNFYAGFANIKPTLDAINAWNRDKRFGNAYVDSDLDAAIEYDVNLEYGVSRQNLDAAFAIWSTILDDYIAYVGYKAE